MMGTNEFRPTIIWIEPLKPVGEEGKEWGKLLGQLEINGVPHHIEGWAVQDNEETHEQEAIDPFTSYEEVTNAMTEGAGVTVPIDGHEYFMVITPHQL